MVSPFPVVGEAEVSRSRTTMGVAPVMCSSSTPSEWESTVSGQPVLVTLIRAVRMKISPIERVARSVRPLTTTSIG